MQVRKGRSVEKIIEDQIRQWQLSAKSKKQEEKKGVTVITLSRQPGSGGDEIAPVLAETLGYDLFDREIIQQMAENARISARILETIDEKGMNLLEETIADLIEERHLWPDQYLKHLMRVVGAIARHGKAVIVGRGANFILPSDQAFRIRIIAPMEIRVERVARERKISKNEARRLILKVESDRRAFSRKYFYANVEEPTNYDMIINTEKETSESVAAAVKVLMHDLA